MAPITYDIDPEGDVEVVLKGTINTQAIIPCLNRVFGDECRDPEYDGDTDSHFDNPYLNGRYDVFDDDDTALGDKIETEVWMRVSSRHLILASSMFRVMLNGPWSKNLASHSKSGPSQIKASGWDPAAFAIVLDAIHGRYDGIPDTINIGLLARIAAVVDYYDCHECLRPISYIWTANLCKNYKRPATVCKSSLMWLSVSCVFSSHDLMNSMSRIILRQTTIISCILTKDLPLSPVLEKIDATRQELVHHIVTALDKLREQLLKETSCPRGDRNCPTMMLGNLMRIKHSLWVFDEPPDFPYDGNSVHDIITEIARSSGHSGSYGRSSCSCTIKSRLKDVLDGVEKDMSNFSLT